MRIPLRLSSHPYIHDLIDVVAYGVAVVAVAGVTFFGIWVAAPGFIGAAATVSHAMDRWVDADGDDADHRLSNFQRWLAARDAAKGAQPDVVPKPEPVAAAPVRIGPVGVAARMRAKALAEIGAGRGHRHSPARQQDDVTLPPGAQPVEQTGYTPAPPADKHRIY